MEIFVQTPSGTLTAQVLPTDTIESIRAAIYRGTSVAPRDQVLSFDGRVLRDGHRLGDYAVRRGDIISAGHEGITALQHAAAPSSLALPQVPAVVPAGLLLAVAATAVVRAVARRGGHHTQPHF